MFGPLVVALLLSALTADGTGIQAESSSSIGRRPKNCHDLSLQGNLYEDHYIVYPEVSNNATIVYCSRDDGMETPAPNPKVSAKNCNDLQTNGLSIIYPDSDNPLHPVMVVCDQLTDGGGFTVIQNRYDGSVNFYQSWSTYAEGFGVLEEEYYLGNDNIAAITGQSVNELLIEMEDWSGYTRYAHYDMFEVKPYILNDWNYNYQMFADFYHGTAGDSLADHSGWPFSTYDRDNDSYTNADCAEWLHGAWWYKDCGGANLNGRYYHAGDTGSAHDGIQWATWKGPFYSLKKVSMKVRPYSSQH